MHDEFIGIYTDERQWLKVSDESFFVIYSVSVRPIVFLGHFAD